MLERRYQQTVDDVMSECRQLQEKVEKGRRKVCKESVSWKI